MLNFEFENYMNKVIEEADSMGGSVRENVCDILEMDDSHLFTGEQIVFACNIILMLKE